MKRLLALFALLLPLVTAAQVYEIRDESGRVIGYSDTPPPGSTNSQQIEVREPNTSAPPPDIPRPPPPPPAEEKRAYKVNITNPATETVIPIGDAGNFTVNVRVAPDLHEDDQLQLFVDGVALGEPQRRPNFALVNVYRGAHDIMIRAVSADGDNLGESETIRIYVRRTIIRR